MIFPFLTAPERQGYQQVPAMFNESDLRQHFHLTGADWAFIQRQQYYVGHIQLPEEL